LIQHIEQIALTLRAEGILLLPPIEWDGRLGLEEQRVLDRLGFLLNAYHVEVFYWELVELVSSTHTHTHTHTPTNHDAHVHTHTVAHLSHSPPHNHQNTRMHAVTLTLPPIHNTPTTHTLEEGNRAHIHHTYTRKKTTHKSFFDTLFYWGASR